MEKLWTGRFASGLDDRAGDYNSSLRVDRRMYRQDITGSIAHAKMLGKQNIITAADAELIIQGLRGLLEDIECGKLLPEGDYEDIHSFVETMLTKRIGDAGARLHTARSRNDQVALDLRLYLRDELIELRGLLVDLVAALTKIADQHADTILCGYTHLQRAQPVTLGHHLCAYAFMLLRDIDRLDDCKKRLNHSPLGSAALAGTGFPIDRLYTAELLEMDGVCENSLDGVSDRDFVAESGFLLSLIMTHLSRFAEELILWSSWEFGYIELSDAFSTGSSIMPQKKNADIAELIRGRSGRVYGNLMGLLTMLKGLPLAYNKDMQEDKEAIFDSIDTVKDSVAVLAPMLLTMRVKKENLRSAAARGFINATDGADYLAAKGVPFRKAYKIMGEIVAHCIREKVTLEELSLADYKSFSDVFEEDLYAAIDLEACVAKRTSRGGTSPDSVRFQIQLINQKIGR